jgi:hypothetical protein
LKLYISNLLFVEKVEIDFGIHKDAEELLLAYGCFLDVEHLSVDITKEFRLLSVDTIVDQ